jgi:transcriptional regulator
MAPRRKDLLHGTLDLIVLQLLAGDATNGWDLAQRIQATTRDALSVNAGSLYPALYRLQAKGLIRADWRTTENNRRAKFYSLTPAGHKRLGEETESWKRLVSAMSSVLRARPEEA